MLVEELDVLVLELSVDTLDTLEAVWLTSVVCEVAVDEVLRLDDTDVVSDSVLCELIDCDVFELGDIVWVLVLLELLTEVTGEALDPGYFKARLERRYLSG